MIDYTLSLWPDPFIFSYAVDMDIVLIVIGVAFGVTVHEFCHAWMADRLGDPTPRMQGRISLNPIRHFDLFGTLALIFFNFGWGKPVQYNPHNLKYPKRDGALIALAGPMANLVTALVLAAPLKSLAQLLVSDATGPAGTAAFIIYAIFKAISDVSIILFSLNVLPFPPFDGSKIIGLFVPKKYERAYMHYLDRAPIYVILFIIFDVIFINKVFHISLLNLLVGSVAKWIYALVSLGA